MDTGTLADRVYQTLRQQILRGTYKPGQRLNLAQLSRTLNVSNTPIREAIARLERLGLIEMVPYSGPRIKCLNASQLADLCDVRVALEELAVRQTILRNEPAALEGMAKALEMQERAYDDGDPRAVVEADRAFHDALIQASGNSALLEMLPNLSDRTWLMIELNTPSSEKVDPVMGERVLRSHRRILDALRAGDQETAVQAIRRHLTKVKEGLVLQMMKSRI